MNLINLRRKSIVEKLTEGNEVFLLGADNWGRKAYKFFKENIKVLYFIRYDILKSRKIKSGLPNNIYLKLEISFR
jgi:hypothetical protein